MNIVNLVMSGWKSQLCFIAAALFLCGEKNYLLLVQEIKGRENHYLSFIHLLQYFLSIKIYILLYRSTFAETSLQCLTTHDKAIKPFEKASLCLFTVSFSTFLLMNNNPFS